MKCMFCGGEIDLDRDFRGVHGFEQRRTAGGANQITLREVVPGEFACENCIRLKRHGIDPAQGSLV